MAMRNRPLVAAQSPTGNPLFTSRRRLATVVRDAEVTQEVEVVAPGTDLEGDEVECSMPDVSIRRLESGDEGTNAYFLKMTVSGETTQRYMTTVEKDAKKNANFPGFKKGQIPPWARPQLVKFCVETAINDGMIDAMESAGIQKLEGEAGNAEVLEDVSEIIKAFKVGEPISFTAKFNGKESESADV